MLDKSQLIHKNTKSKTEIQAWLITQIAEVLYLDPQEISASAPFSSYGLSSRDAVLLSGDLEEWLDRRLSPTLIYEYSSIDVLAAHLSIEDIANDVKVTAQDQLAGRQQSENLDSASLEERISDLEELTDEEAEALLLERLNQLSKK